jgi:hypothetical protein
VERTRAQFADTGLLAGHNAYDYHFAALKRLLDRREPNYAE